MRILLDHCLDWRLKRLLPEHNVIATFEKEWDAVKNGKLLALAEQEFDVFVTIDQSIRHQQNLRDLAMAVVVLTAPSNRFRDTAPLMPQVRTLLPTVLPDQLYEISAPTSSA